MILGCISDPKSKYECIENKLDYSNKYNKALEKPIS